MRQTIGKLVLTDRSSCATGREVLWCGAALEMIRESYEPSEPIELICIAAFLHGAGAAFNMDAELGDVASLKDIANG